MKSDNLWAPRLGFSWDVIGDSSFKVFGNAGRYFIPVAYNTIIRASGAEATDDRVLPVHGVAIRSPVPRCWARSSARSVSTALHAPDPRTVAATNLSPMYQDEYILGMQKQLNENWNIGLRGINRKVKDGFDDTCAHQPLVRLGGRQRLHELRPG